MAAKPNSRGIPVEFVIGVARTDRLVRGVPSARADSEARRRYLMKHTIIATAISTALLFTGSLQAAKADTWVCKDMLRPNGHERSMSAKRADARKCGADRSGRSFSDTRAPNMQSCMFNHRWTLSQIIPDPPSRHARVPDNDYSPP